ncbi:hypothetical protein ACHAW6_013363 [Cyclotella cf. meneghiniana]
MSAYARQSSIAFRSAAADHSSNRRDGIRRFSQRRVSLVRYNDKLDGRSVVDNRKKDQNESAAFHCEESAPIEGSIHASNAEEYPFSQITMSQCSAGEGSFFSLRSSGVAATANVAMESRGRPLSGTREFGRYSSSKQANTPSTNNDAVGGPSGQTGASTEETNDDDSVQSSQPLLTPLPPRNNYALQRTDQKQQQHQQQQRFSTRHSSKDPPKSTPRRDKRARIQLTHLVVRPAPQQQQMPPPQLQQSLSMRHPFQTLSSRRAFATVATSTLHHSISTPSSFVARSAHAVRSVAASAMTPLRKLRLGQSPVANAARITPRQHMGYAASSSGITRDASEEQLPSPLDRSAKTRLEEKKETASFLQKNDDHESVVECSVPIKQTHGIDSFQLSQSSNGQDATIENDDDDDANTKTSASTYDPNKMSVLQTDDVINFQQKADDILARIETAKKEMDVTKKEMEQQRQLIDSKHRELLQAQESLASQRREIFEMINNQEDVTQLVKRATKDIEAKANEVKETIERSLLELNTSSQDQRDRLCQLIHDSKEDIQVQISRLVDDCKASIQVCGKLEIDALEKEGHVIKTELLQLVEKAGGDLKSECQCSIETLQAESRGVETHLHRMMQDVVDAAKNDFDMWASNLVDKENAKPSDCDAARRSPLEIFEAPTVKSMMGAVTRFASGIEGTLEVEDNSEDDECSLRNNSSISPTPVSRRTPRVQKSAAKEISSTFSKHSELRTGISVSTPFSRKATPRIKNSNSKAKGIPQKKADSSSHKMKNSSPSLSAVKRMNSDSAKDSTTDVNLKESVSATPTSIHSKIGATLPSKATKLKAPVRAVKKRTRRTITDPSPRRSKRLRESARAEKKIEVHHSQVFEENAKDDHLVKPQVTQRDFDISSTITNSPKDMSSSFNGNDDVKDVIVGTVVNTGEILDVNLDGCESIVQRDVGPLAIPWGVRNAPKTRRIKSYSMSRKRDKKRLSLESQSSTFEFRF